MINSILNDNNKINNNKNFLPEEKLSKWVFENPGNKRNCEIAKERILNIIEASNSYFANAVAKELDLSGLQLTTLPPCINGLTNLTKLNLLGNQITTIAANAFNGLTNLTELNLSGNKITTIAANAFNGLTNLTMLHLSNNQITTIEAN
ncbi:MAG TPA: leucine-rich repeat domain-containing protein, partial [Burkholderiales bacterium]|nr:leucine-rich repeat domain-containing protein [Burkholderiales bacterium]